MLTLYNIYTLYRHITYMYTRVYVYIYACSALVSGYTVVHSRRVFKRRLTADRFTRDRFEMRELCVSIAKTEIDTSAYQSNCVLNGLSSRHIIYINTIPCYLLSYKLVIKRIPSSRPQARKKRKGRSIP